MEQKIKNRMNKNKTKKNIINEKLQRVSLLQDKELKIIIDIYKKLDIHNEDLVLRT